MRHTNYEWSYKRINFSIDFKVSKKSIGPAQIMLNVRIRLI